MPYYVRIDRMNGRRDFYNLAKNLNDHGYDDRVEYNPGGWVDNLIYTAAPHLKFVLEEDALAYSLTYGTTYGTIIPSDVRLTV